MTATDLDALTTALADDLDAAFPAIVEALQDGVFSGALRMTRDHHAAEDITQEAFVRAYRALGTYSAERIRNLRLAGWIWTIAANLCRNRARSRSRKPEASLPDDGSRIPDPTPSPEEVALDAVDDTLARLVADLPWAQRAAVVLRHVVGLDYRAIAEALDRLEPTVRSDVHRALATLRKEMP